MRFFTSFLKSKDAVVNPDLLRLLERLNIKHQNDLPSIVTATQKAWLRPEGKERWEIEKEWSLEDREAVLVYYKSKGLLEERMPSQQEYETALICGSTVESMRQRLKFFEKIWSQGIRFKEIIFLTGTRPLDARIETAPTDCQTEAEAMMALWKESPLFSKVRWKNLPHPMIPLEGGLFRRATTIDTFKLWLTTRPNTGPHLIIVD